MLLIISILLYLSSVSQSLFLPNKPNVSSYSGFKVECQVSLSNFPSNEFHLLYYLDNKLIWDKPLNDSTIPWTKPIRLNDIPGKTTSLVLARRKSFALRKYPIYFPDSLIGAIFDGMTNTTLSPLVADDLISNYYIQVSRSLGIILHLPILLTPNTDSTKFNFLQELTDWDKHLKINEDYKYYYNSKYSVRKSLDFFINNLNNIKYVKKFINLNKNLSGDFVLIKLFLLGKYSKAQFGKALANYDSLMQYN